MKADKHIAFTLLELLVVISVISILSALLLPALRRGKAAAQNAKCLSNLRQLSLATQMYWDDNNGCCFRYGGIITNGGQLYWFGWIGPGPEGQRQFDMAPSALFPYLQGRGIELCPAFNYFSPSVKLKASGASFGYGYNLYLSAGAREPPIKSSRVVKSASTTLFADAAQVNTWQAPASAAHPMLEEWYYVDNSSNQPNGHFRHAAKAQVAYVDGHSGKENFVRGSIDPRMPAEMVGRLPEESLLLP